jgi:hypothetical protein
MKKIRSNFEYVIPAVRRISFNQMSQSMAIKLSLSILLVLIISEVAAQRLRTIELQPIHRQGGSYYYNFKRVEGGPYGLQIPLQSLDDEEINAHYKKFRSFRVFEGAASLVPLIYLLSITANHQHQPNSQTFWTVWGVSAAAVIALEIGARKHLKKGINRYNELILQPSGRSPGLSLTYRF